MSPRPIVCVCVCVHVCMHLCVSVCVLCEGVGLLWDLAGTWPAMGPGGTLACYAMGLEPGLLFSCRLGPTVEGE